MIKRWEELPLLRWERKLGSVLECVGKHKRRRFSRCGCLCSQAASQLSSSEQLTYEAHALRLGKRNVSINFRRALLRHFRWSHPLTQSRSASNEGTLPRREVNKRKEKSKNLQRTENHCLGFAQDDNGDAMPSSSMRHASLECRAHTSFMTDRQFGPKPPRSYGNALLQ